MSWKVIRQRIGTTLPPCRLSTAQTMDGTACLTGTSVTLRESRAGKPSHAINTSPVNNGVKPVGTCREQIFSLGNPPGLTDTWTHQRRRCLPGFPPFPPYLVFDSGTRTNP